MYAPCPPPPIPLSQVQSGICIMYLPLTKFPCHVFGGDMREFTLSYSVLGRAFRRLGTFNFHMQELTGIYVHNVYIHSLGFSFVCKGQYQVYFLFIHYVLKLFSTTKRSLLKKHLFYFMRFFAPNLLCSSHLI